MKTYYVTVLTEETYKVYAEDEEEAKHSVVTGLGDHCDSYIQKVIEVVEA